MKKGSSPANNELCHCARLKKCHWRWYVGVMNRKRDKMWFNFDMTQSLSWLIRCYWNENGFFFCIKRIWPWGFWVEIDAEWFLFHQITLFFAEFWYETTEIKWTNAASVFKNSNQKMILLKLDHHCCQIIFHFVSFVDCWNLAAKYLLLSK